MISLSKNAEILMNCFEDPVTIELFENTDSNTEMELNIIRSNGQETNYDSLIRCLSEVLTDYALTRTLKEQYINESKYSQLSKEARSKFRKYAQNKGELGELFLYSFLEGALKAPQILSKLPLKTTSGDYVKGVDGIHILKLENGDRYHLIYGESKMYSNLTSGFSNAFKSIREHFDDTGFEKSIISSHLDSEFSEAEDKKEIIKILYAEKDKSINVSDSFGIFIGFEFDNTEGDELAEDKYAEWLNDTVISLISDKREQIEEQNLRGKNFYIYLIPFVALDDTREKITEEILK